MQIDGAGATFCGDREQLLRPTHLVVREYPTHS